MSGHSKWATIKRKKAKTDVGRATAWNKLIKEISVAAKMGGGNPDANPRLRTAILKAKGQSLPAKNIESAIAKGIGGNSGANMEEPMYEGYGPAGCAILVQCLTDNRTRSVADIRNIFSKNGGNMGTEGSVSWNFKKERDCGGGLLCLPRRQNYGFGFGSWCKRPHNRRRSLRN